MIDVLKAIIYKAVDPGHIAQAFLEFLIPFLIDTMDGKTIASDSEPEEVNRSIASTFIEMKKSCLDCHTTRTPLWRGGPAGPRFLCNACGIRYRKTRKALLGLDKGRAGKPKRKNIKGDSKLGISLKPGLMAIGREMGEEEEAAILLKSLSYGCVYL